LLSLLTLRVMDLYSDC